MNTHNESILAEYRQNHSIYEQLECRASELLECELKQSGIMVFQLSHRLKTEESLRGKLEKKGLKIIASNWVYGERHTMTTKPVKTVDDLKGMKIRVPGNKIQTEGFNALGATATGMPLGEVYQALQSKTIEGAENPLGTLYGRKLQEVAKYLILDGHVKNFTTWIVSDQWFKKLTPEQQKWLLETAEEAGLENNKVQAASEKDYLEKLKKEGVQVVVPTPEVLKGFKEKSKSFYAKGKDFGWSDGLYEKVTKAMQ